MKTPSRAPSGPSARRRSVAARRCAYSRTRGSSGSSSTMAAERYRCGHERIRSRRGARAASPHGLRDRRRGTLVHARRATARLHAVGRQPPDGDARAARRQAADRAAARQRGGDPDGGRGDPPPPRARADQPRQARLRRSRRARRRASGGTFRFGTYQSASTSILPHVLRELRGAVPARAGASDGVRRRPHADARPGGGPPRRHRS